MDKVDNKQLAFQMDEYGRAEINDEAILNIISGAGELLFSDNSGSCNNGCGSNGACANISCT
jgi:hypothetical protein